MRSQDGGPVEASTLRVTHVCRRENGEWKIVHRHASVHVLDDLKNRVHE
jgi:ketosteroid isomerase-like protein